MNEETIYGVVEEIFEIHAPEAQPTNTSIAAINQQRLRDFCMQVLLQMTRYTIITYDTRLFNSVIAHLHALEKLLIG